MTGERRETTLLDIAVPTRGTVSGPFGSSISKQFFVCNGVPVIRGNNLSLGTDGPRFRDDDFVYLTSEKAKELSSAECVPGDLIFTARGTIGQVGLIPLDARFPRYILSANQLRLRSDPKIADALYLYYWFSSPQMVAVMQGRNAGSALPNMNLGALRGLPVVLPPLPEQRIVAHILGALDDKIELNRRMNETLEGMARALFKSWFIDFDPVHAKAAGRDPGLPANIAALFPDSFQNSDVGDIPTGWAIGVFSDLVVHLREQESPLSQPDKLFSHYSLPAFDEGQSPTLDYGETIKSVKWRVSGEVVLLSKLNPEIERVWLVNVDLSECAVCSTEFLVLRARPPFTRSYVYCLARSPLLRQQIESLVTGTSKSHQRAQTDSILNLAVVVPPSPLVRVFDRFSASLLVRTLECRNASHTLATLRDTLLPKLLSGELRVKDVEQSIEAHA